MINKKSEAARQLADETGRSPATIRTAIQREETATASLTQLTGTDKHSPYASSANKPNSEIEHVLDEPDDDAEQTTIEQETPTPQEQPKYNHRAMGTGGFFR